MEKPENPYRLLKDPVAVSIVLEKDLRDAAMAVARAQGLSLSALIRLLLLQYLEQRTLPAPHATLADIKQQQT